MTVRELDPFVHGDRFAYSTHQLRCLQCGGDAIKRVKHVDQTNFDDALMIAAYAFIPCIVELQTMLHQDNWYLV